MSITHSGSESTLRFSGAGPSTPPSTAEASQSGEPTRTSEPPGAYRILVVDDNPSIHDDFRRIFAAERSRDEDLDALAASLFGLAAPPARPAFELDHVSQGQAALEQVLAALEEGAPYALLFMDVRMPPGWDGVEAAMRVLEGDPDVHVVLCTAYPERGWRKRVESLPGRDRLLVLRKPFDTFEVQQLACALCEKWRYARRDRARMVELERSVTKQQGELAAAESRLRKAERLEGLGRLAAGLCHEINNPLSYIVTSAELMQEDLDDIGEMVPTASREELGQMLEAISMGASRITRLVRNIKMFARHSDGALEVVELDQAIATAVGMIQPKLLPRVEIVTDTGGAVPVQGRRFELEQVLINLVENALHAMAEQQDPLPRVTVTTRITSSRSVAIDVVDTGPGIDEAILDKVFDPFFTTKPVNQGTGLGLSICHTLISDMNGSIDARNHEQRGAVFTITLPVATRARPVLLPSAPSATATLVARRGRILVVDDEPLMLSMVERVLRPHSVSCCASAGVALEQCSREVFDVILCDVMMPGTDGCEFRRELARLYPGMEERVVFMTGGALLDDVRDLLAQVPNRMFEKPFDPSDLRALVAEELDKVGPIECPIES